ncbi:hypothetical protein MHLP_00865 [Candidatus Mycoplasma haematolamae str. Purdue]|uniref:Uncharacterized protein n=1 Tax=Mycoplasma haematolamae (strain Purdue) TaxID=1212765 RepID=I7BIV0_MYCHA|nr:hypothetical protein MHLP_00865 [Candidatus Mycoplasma haematolamae str. Purdue]
MRTALIKIVAPATLATGSIGGGGYYVSQYLLPRESGNPDQDQNPKTKESQNEDRGQGVQGIQSATSDGRDEPAPLKPLGDHSFEISLSSAEGRRKTLVCRDPELTQGQHYQIGLWKITDTKAEITCSSENESQSSSQLRIKDKSSEDEDQEVTGPIADLSCDSFQDGNKEKLNVFVCTISGNKSVSMTLEEGSSKIVFEIQNRSS